MTAVMTLLSPGEAQRLTQRIKLTASVVRDNLFKLKNLVEEAKASNAWNILGYASWTAYLADTLGDEPMRLGREERQELVGYLSGEGLSTRAIAPILGVDNKTVHNDIRRIEAVENSTPEPTEVVDQQTGEILEVEDVRTALGDDVAAAYETVDWNLPTPVEKVTGTDGKTYAKTSSTTPRRRSLVDDAYTANTKLWEAIERVRSLTTDDRYTRNKADILAALQPSADLANEVLSNLFTPTKEQ
jgi:hypothetical protein